jgi:acyl-CoA hydrolase
VGLRPFVAINSAMAVDVRGQVGLFKNMPDAYPPGGLLDFAIAGAYGGLSIIALTSQTSDHRSRVVADLGAVHLPGSLVSHVVTEYGVAEVRGRSESERRTALLAIAHPDHGATILEADGLVRNSSSLSA